MKKNIVILLGFLTTTQFTAFSFTSSRQPAQPASRSSIIVAKPLRTISPRNVKGFSAPSAFSRINVPHQRQETLLCVPTSTSMMLNKIGFNYPPRQIKLATLDKPYYGPSAPFSAYTPMSISGLMHGLKKLGITTWKSKHYFNSEFDRGFSEIKASISTGKPVLMIATMRSRSSGSIYGHAMVISGYDDRRQRLYLIDPDIPRPGLRMISYLEFQRDYWHNGFGGLTSRSVVFMNPIMSYRTMGVRINSPTEPQEQEEDYLAL
jgi:hypothetical protein